MDAKPLRQAGQNLGLDVGAEERFCEGCLAEGGGVDFGRILTVWEEQVTVSKKRGTQEGQRKKIWT